MELNKEALDKMRNIEGFPIGKDEDIIKLSNPPYYTACPNPFINEFIDKNGTPYDEENDDYNVEPYTADVSEGKTDPVYNGHPYHTKIPYKAIMRYILHYTKPGDIVYDGFCGTGMTGVAALSCSCPDDVLKLHVESENQNVKWGERRAILSDLSPIASFIAYNYLSNVNTSILKKELISIIDILERECGWMYETNHIVNGVEQVDLNGEKVKGRINYVIWSDVFICPSCQKDYVYWEVSIDKEKGEQLEVYSCPVCGVNLKKRDCQRMRINKFDEVTGEMIEYAKQVPVKISYSVGKKEYKKEPDKYDIELIERIDNLKIPYWYPTAKLPLGYNTEQPKRSHGFNSINLFYTKRNLYLLAYIFNLAGRCSEYEHIIKFILTSLTNRASKLSNLHISNFFHGGGGAAAGNMKGIIYVPSFSLEQNVIEYFKIRYEKVLKLKKSSSSDNFIVSTMSCTDSNTVCPKNSIDYIFTDPPFGENIMYSELNFLWEAWLKVFTNNKTEAIINKVQKKDLYDYQQLMEESFEENYRLLKPGRWMTIVFHNSKNSVWNSIQEAMLKAGFVVANVKTLDKKQGSFKQVTTTSAVKQDLVISAYKPKTSFVERFLMEAGTEEGVWDFIREHLSKLPVTVEHNGVLDVIPERQNYLLYDSMVAFHIQKGATVPLGSADFYLGLKQRFPERDGMYFLPGQVSIYDAKRMTQELNDQLSLFVLDEKTAIQWLHKELATPQTYQDVQPKFLQELKQLKYEKMPELRDLLEENFLQDEHGKWYVPNVSKQSDLEKLRDKKLLKEFDEYRNSKGKLKVFRTEAIRAGFKHCWKEKDYKTIVNIGERMPEAVVQEDPSILMYYDNALTRIGD